MSFATNGQAQPSKACEMGFARLVGVAPIGRLWYKSAALSSQTSESVPQICPIRVRPGCHRPPGLVCGHRPITEREVNCVV
jgi:hypothetical protein